MFEKGRVEKDSGQCSPKTGFGKHGTFDGSEAAETPPTREKCVRFPYERAGEQTQQTI